MKLEDIICLESIKLELVSKSKREVLHRMVELAAKSGKVKDIAELKKQVIEREELSTTAIGNSVALPHAKSFAVTSITASFAVLKTPVVGFNAIDDKPVQILFLILANENLVGKQLRYLSFFSTILSDSENVTKLLQFSSEKEIYNFLNATMENI